VRNPSAASTRIRPVVAADRTWIASLLTDRWGSPELVSRGRVFDGLQLSGFVAILPCPPHLSAPSTLTAPPASRNVSAPPTVPTPPNVPASPAWTNVSAPPTAPNVSAPAASPALPGPPVPPDLPDSETVLSPAGLATYRIEGGECELVSLDSLVERRGVGSALIAAVHEAALAAGCQRLWLITTNDNAAAQQFYERRGFRLVAIHKGAMAVSRRLKPCIPLVGLQGIPLEDELEYERILIPSGSSSADPQGRQLRAP